MIQTLSWRSTTTFATLPRAQPLGSCGNDGSGSKVGNLPEGEPGSAAATLINCGLRAATITNALKANHARDRLFIIVELLKIPCPEFSNTNRVCEAQPRAKCRYSNPVMFARKGRFGELLETIWIC